MFGIILQGYLRGGKLWKEACKWNNAESSLLEGMKRLGEGDADVKVKEVS